MRSGHLARLGEAERAGARLILSPQGAAGTIATDEDCLIQPWFWIAFNVFVLGDAGARSRVFRGRENAVYSRRPSSVAHLDRLCLRIRRTSI